MAFAEYIPLVLSVLGTLTKAHGTSQAYDAQAAGFEAQIPAVDYKLQSFLSGLAIQQAAGLGDAALKEQALSGEIQAANFNAKTAIENAAIAMEQARAKAKQITRGNMLRMGMLRAHAGASGFDAGSGSAVDVAGDVMAQGLLDRQNALYAGALQARGFSITAYLNELKAQNAYAAGRTIAANAGIMSGLYGQAAALARTSAANEIAVLQDKANQTRTAGDLSATSTLIDGAANAAKIYNDTHTPNLGAQGPSSNAEAIGQHHLG